MSIPTVRQYDLPSSVNQNHGALNKLLGIYLLFFHVLKMYKLARIIKMYMFDKGKKCMAYIFLELNFWSCFSLDYRLGIIIG